MPFTTQLHVFPFVYIPRNHKGPNSSLTAVETSDNRPSPSSAFTYRMSLLPNVTVLYSPLPSTNTSFSFYSLCAWTHRSCIDSQILASCFVIVFEVSEGCKIKRCKIARINRFKGARFCAFIGPILKIEPCKDEQCLICWNVLLFYSFELVVKLLFSVIL